MRLPNTWEFTNRRNMLWLERRAVFMDVSSLSDDGDSTM
jgi:hypothetical protein